MYQVAMSVALAYHRSKSWAYPVFPHCLMLVGSPFWAVLPGGCKICSQLLLGKGIRASLVLVPGSRNMSSFLATR
jgi:hypothetical protein